VLLVIYWIVMAVIQQSDLAMFPRFLSSSLGALGFLVLFLVFWFTNGTVRGRVRLAAFGIFLAGAVVAILLADRTLNPMSYLLTAVPYVLSAWALWLAFSRLRRVPVEVPALAVIILATLGLFDLIRWEGVDGRLRSSMSWRWSKAPEDAFLATRTAGASQTTRPWKLQAGDWPEFRGERRDGIVRGLQIGSDWKAKPPQQLWKTSVGPGWSSVIVVDGFLVTQEQRGDQEAVVCYEAETGKEVWAHQDAVRFSEGLSGAGPRATPTWHEGRIYALGAKGRLLALEASSGKVLWARETSETFPMWGYATSPLVTEGKVIVFAGGKLLAFDETSGSPLWSRESGKESYSSAELLSVGGKRHLVMHDNKRLMGVSLADGAVLWERAGESEAVVPMLQPHPAGEGLLLVASGTGVSLLEIKEEGGKWSVAEKWTTKKFHPSFNDFVVHGGRIFGLDDGVLTCVDVKTGERVWKKGRFGYGQVLLLEEAGVLIVLSESGEIAAVEAKGEEPGDVVRLPALEGKTWNHPVVVRDRLFIRNGTQMIGYRLELLKAS
jgi:outer membrane protein assembly factor BamB